MITYTTAPQRVAAKVSRAMAITLLTAAMALCFGLLVIASLPGSL